jgi:hypothetical protein
LLQNNYHKGGHRKVFLDELVADGKILIAQVELNEYVQKNYENLYSTDPKDDTVITTRVEFFIVIPYKVSKK